MRVNSGVQVNSLSQRVIALVERYYPSSNKLYVTSAYRPDDSGSHHSGLSYNGSATAAVDFGGYDLAPSRAAGQQEMRLASLWLFDNFWDLSVELIHTNPDDNYYTYVKNQRKVGAYAAADHVNHIHWATSTALMTQIETRAAARWGQGAPVTTGRGPFLPLPAEGHYFGDINGPAESHGGHPSASPHDRGYVSRIQEALGIAADGVFGQGTVSAVKSFQQARGLGVDGRVGRQTWEKLFPVE